MIRKTFIASALLLTLTTAQAVSTIKPPPPWQSFVDWISAAVKKPPKGY